MKNDRSLIHLDIGAYPQSSSHDTFWPSISAEWHTLYKAIQQNTEISEIRISNQNGDKSCQRVLLDGLLKNRCIRKVHLFGIDLDQWLISKICHYVRRNRMKAGLAELHISNCTVAHKEFADFLFRTEHYLHSLSLNGLHIHDNAMSDIIEAIANNSNKSLQKLDLSRNPGIGNNTLLSCIKLISDPLCNLQSVELSEYIVNDEVACALADAISKNRHSKLKYLDLVQDDTHPCRMTHVGWAAFAKALCDPSSWDTTINSNHVLVSLGYPPLRLLHAGAPPELLSYINWNLSGMGKKTKLVQVHFVSKFDENKFKTTPLAVVPWILEWLSRGSVSAVSFSAVYNILRKNTGVIIWGRSESKSPLHSNDLLVSTTTELVRTLGLDNSKTR